jgi:polysaccharide export outer membrane protein
MSPLFRICLGLLATGIAVAGQTLPTGRSGKITQYHLTTGDTIAVDVFGEQLGVKTRIDEQGKIHCALIDNVYVYGDTLEQAEAAIAKAYVDQQILAHPKVTVTVVDYAERAVSVQGAVKQPRKYPLDPERITSLADVIVEAGGFTDVAHGTDVRVTRVMPDGTTKVFDHVDVEDMLKGKLKDQAKLDQAKMPLQPGDVIYVPERII